MAFAYLIDADIPKNDGAFRILRVIARPGTVVWANEGAPVTLCTSHCSNEIVEAIITALADACPDRAMAKRVPADCLHDQGAGLRDAARRAPGGMPLRTSD